VLPPTWRSSSFEAAPLAVFVALTRRAASTTPLVFQAGVIESAGRVCEPFSEFFTFNGVAAEPGKVEICTS
jgi:hypothetical protein